MSIFGTDKPRFTASSVNIDLDYCEVIRSEPEYAGFLQKNDLTGAHGHVDRGYHWVYEVKYYIYKETDPAGKFNQLAAILGTEIDKLCPHRDQTELQDSSGTARTFFFVEMVPDYVERVNYRDVLNLKFVSSGFVDISKSMS
jgi:glutaredoxin-related protein